MYSSDSILREQDELMFDLLSKHRRLRLFEQAVKREPLLENLSPRLVTHWFESRTLGETSSSSASTFSSSGGSSPSENADTSLQWQQAHHHNQQHLGSNVTYHSQPPPTTTVHYDSGVPAALDHYSPTSAPSGQSQHRHPAQDSSKLPSRVIHQPIALKYGADEMAIAHRDNWLLQLQQQDQMLNAAANRQRDQLETRRRFELDQSRLLEQDFLSHGLNLRVHRVRIREWLRLNQPQCGEPLEVKLVPTAGGTIITTTVYNNDRYSMHLPLRSLVALTLGSDSITLQTCERPSFYVIRRATGQSQTSADFTTERSASTESQHVFGVVSSELVVVRAQLEQLACSLPLLRVLLFPKPISSVLQPQTLVGTSRSSSLAWASSMASPHLATSKSSPALLGAAGYEQQPAGIGSVSSPDAFARPAHQRSVSWTTRAAYEDDCDRAAAIDLARLQAGSRSNDVKRPIEQHPMASRALPPPFGATSALEGSHPCPVPPPTTPEHPNKSSDDMHAPSPSSIDAPRSRESTPQCSELIWDMFASRWSSTVAASTQTISCSASPSSASQVMNKQSEVTPRPSNATLGVIGDPASPSPSGEGPGSKHSDVNPPCFMWNPFEATYCFNIQDGNSSFGSEPNEGSSTTNPDPDGTKVSSMSMEKSDSNLQAENENLLDYDPTTLHLFTTPPHSDLHLNFGLENTSSWPW